MFQYHVVKRTHHRTMALEETVELLTQIPLPICGIYFLLRKGSVVYVGQSENITLRVLNHQKEAGKDFDSYAYFRCAPMELTEMEAEMIVKYLPEYNGALPRNRKYRSKPCAIDGFRDKEFVLRKIAESGIKSVATLRGVELFRLSELIEVFPDFEPRPDVDLYNRSGKRV